MSQNLCNYVWRCLVATSRGYGFNLSHTLGYSLVALQEMNLAYKYPIIYWNTACLIVNSGSLENSQESNDGKQAATDYTKMARALGATIAAGIKISLVDINHSDFTFIPDAENNQILFGLKGLTNVGDEVINTIIANRPYESPRDFLNKVKPNKQVMVSLIKGGAFDSMMDRKLCLGWYIWETCDKKRNVTLQNLNGLMTHGMLPEDTEERVMARRIYEFNRYLKTCCFTKGDTVYRLDDRALSFLTEINKLDSVSPDNTITLKKWDNIYQKWMDVFRNWIAQDKKQILQDFNTSIFLEDWKKYGSKNNLSAWEMEALCFYYHEHELKDINYPKYGIAHFDKIPEEPIVEKVYKKGDHTFETYKLFKICGTCLAKNKAKSSISLLTVDGVVEVKFPKTYFPMFDKRISQKSADGTKKVTLEESWFNRGNMLVVQGIRRGDDFVSKNYANSGGHQLYKIIEIKKDGDIVLCSERAQGEAEDVD